MGKINAKIPMKSIGSAKAYFQFRYGHITEGEKLEVEEVKAIDYTSKNSGKTTRVFNVKLKDQDLDVMVLPTRAIETGIATFEEGDIVWKASAIAKKIEEKESYFVMA